MRIITYTEARKNLRNELDIVSSTNNPTVIMSLKCQVVLISKKEYERIVGEIDKLERKL